MYDGVARMLEQCVVQLSDGDRVGTAFWISPTTLVTCAHVAQSDTVEVTLPDGLTVSARVISRQPEAHSGESWPLPDLAMLETSHAADNWLEIAPASSTLSPDQLIACGFARAGQSTPSLTFETPRAISLEPVDGGRLIKLVDCTLSPGMSGGPLVVATGQVVGILKRSRGASAPNGGWAIPVGQLDAYFPQQVGPIRDALGDQALGGYYRSVATECGTVEPRGIRRNRETQDLVFPLDDVYVSLEVRDYSVEDLNVAQRDEAKPQPPNANSAATPFLALDQLLSYDMNAGTSAEKKHRDPVDLSSIMKGTSRTVVLGDPGSGKSTLLQWLALTFARAGLSGSNEVEAPRRQTEPTSNSEELVSLGQHRVPILVRAPEYEEARRIQSARNGETVTLRAYINTAAAKTASDQTGKIAANIDLCIETGRALILIDGLDEMPDLESRRRLRDEIEQLPVGSLGHHDGRSVGLDPMGLEGNVVVVASRHAGYKDAVLGGTFTHAVIRPLSDASVLRFLSSWGFAVSRAAHRLAGSEIKLLSEQSQNRARAIYASLQEKPSLAELARTPLMLTVVSLVYEEQGRLPRQRTDLLHDMSRILVERRATRHSFHDAQDLLGPFAMWLQRNRPSGLATSEEFERIVNAHLNRVRLTSDLSKNGLVEEFCADAREQFGLIVERGPNLVGFQHRLFQELFCAIELRESGGWASSVGEIEVLDPVWREVVLLTAGLLGMTSRTDVSRFIQDILVLGNVDVVAQSESSRPLLLGADCLLELDRSLPDIATIVVNRLLISVIGAPPAADDSLANLAFSRLSALARQYSGVIDLVAAASLNRIPPGKRSRARLCETIVRLHISANAFRSTLQGFDDNGRSRLSDRRALRRLGRWAPEECPADDDVPPGTKGEDAVLPRLRQRLCAYGPSEAARTVSRWIEMGGSPSDEESSEASVLLGMLGKAHGVEATLLAFACVYLEPESALAVHHSCLSAAGEVPAGELLAWCLVDGVGDFEGLPTEWSNLPEVERSLVLSELGTQPSISRMATRLAWTEIGSVGSDPRSPLSEATLDALQILDRSPGTVLTRGRIELLERLAGADADARLLVERIASVCSASSGMREDYDRSNLPAHEDSLRILEAVSQLENGILSPEIVDWVLEAAQSPNGLWATRIERAISRQRELAAAPRSVIEHVVRIFETHEAEAKGDIGRAALAARFLSSIVIESATKIVELLALYGPNVGEYLLANCPDTTVDGLWELISPHAVVTLDEGLRSSLLEVLVARARQDGLSAIRIPSWTYSHPPQAGDEKVAGIMSGLLLAAEALDPRAGLQGIAGRLLGIDDLLTIRLQEFCRWIGGIPRLEEFLAPERESLLAELTALRDAKIISGSFLTGLAVTLRLAPEVESLQDLMSSLNVSERECILGVVAVGASPSPWAPQHQTVVSTVLVRLQTVLELWSEHDGFVHAFFARAAELLSSRGPGAWQVDEWPEMRFCLTVLWGVSQRSPQAARNAAHALGLETLLVPYLTYPWSFSVRVRAFQLLCLFGVLNESMVQAVRSLVIYEPGHVVHEAFEAIPSIWKIDTEALTELEKMLQSAGRPLVAGLDLVRQLSRSPLYLTEPAFRVGLLLMVGEALDATSEFARARLISGSVVDVRMMAMEALLEIWSGANLQQRRFRWMSFMSSSLLGARATGEGAEVGFGKLFLSQLRRRFQV